MSLKISHELLIQNWQTNGRRDFRKNKLFLKRLNRSRINIRQIQDIHEEVFEQIDCLKCGNCCKTANPTFTQTDVKRIAEFVGMNEAAFEKKYLLTDNDGDIVPNQIPCPLLNYDNTCQVYEARPKSCRSYPHTDVKEGWERPDLLAKNTITCPAAFHIVKRFTGLFGI